MNLLGLTLRIRLPLYSDAFTCKCLGKHFSTSFTHNAGENKDYEVNPNFVNRNPRNLEHLALAPKRQGWVFQSPNRSYYNKLILDHTHRHTTGKVVHWTGLTVISASTKEQAIKKHLHSQVDVSAAENVGAVLAERCLQAGITKVFFDKEDVPQSEKLTAFLKSVEEGCVKIGEPRVVVAHYRPGVDYDGPNRVGNEDKDQPMKDDYQF